MRFVVKIFVDDGVSISFIPQIENLFIDKIFQVGHLSADELKTDDWMTITNLLVIPGGRDVPYIRKVGGLQIFRQQIEKYINQETGVHNYLGICAGAYLGCQSIEFIPMSTCSDETIIGERLGLIKRVLGKGPLYEDKFEYETENGAEILSVQDLHSQKSFLCYYNGGCYFMNIPNECVIWAKFQDFPVMISYKGANKIFLSGVHFEVELKDKIGSEIRKRIIGYLTL